MKDVVVIVADDKIVPIHDCILKCKVPSRYIDHAKSLMVNLRQQGKWTGDIALVYRKGTTASVVNDIERRGVHVIESAVPGAQFQKFMIFDKWFKQWDRALYLDCDVLVQDELQPLFDCVNDKIIVGDQEPFSLFHCFTYWAEWKTYDAAPAGIYDWLWRHYDPCYRQFNTGMLLYRPKELPDSSVKDLVAMQEKLAPVNIHVGKGTDQPVFNLAFYGKFSQIPDKQFCYWEQSVATTRVVHYCSGYAPWVHKIEGMDADINPRIGRNCYELYCENLDSFRDVFPCTR